MFDIQYSKGLITKAIFIAFLSVLIPFVSIAQTYPAPQSPKRFVNDYVQLLSNVQRQQLEQTLLAFNRSTSNEVSVVIINSTEGEDIAAYATDLAHKWGIGKKDKDNGVLLLAAMQDRKVNISVGYGLEGALPDAICKRIIEQQIVPNFKKGQYAEGLNHAITTITKLTTGEYTADQLVSNVPQKKKKKSSWLLLLIILFVFLGRGRGGRGGLLLGLLLGSSTNYSSFSGGRGSFGGGGFGGFGGGGFGGGGASGGW